MDLTISMVTICLEGGSAMPKIFKYLKTKEWLFIGVCIVFIVAQVFLDLQMPDYMSEITSLIQTPGSQISDVWTAGGKMLVCALGSLIAAFIVGYFAAQVATSFSARLREMTFDKTLSFGAEELSTFSISSLITRTTNDITQVQTIVAMGLQAIVKAPILAVWAIVKIMGKNWQWTLATGGAVAALVVMLGVIVVFAIPKVKVIQKQTDNLNRVTRENLTGLRVVRSFNAERYQEEKFEKANTELTNTNLFANRIMAVMHPGMSFIMSGLSLSIYWIGAYLINGAGMMDKMTLFGDMVIYLSYASQVIMAFMLLTSIFILLPRASVSAGRINEVLDRPQTVKDGNVTSSGSGVQGEVEFKSVGFKYPNASDYVLQDVSFTAHKGETVAFIGSTGSGKSTLINLVPRFYDATEGEIFIDGINVKDYAQEALHAKLGYVPQKAVLFGGTIQTNVAYGMETVEAGSVKKAVAVAQGTSFVEKMDGGYGASVSQGGTNLSGGQKQRLSIARAVCREPEIYIFDDSFSALDYKTDRELRAALKNETREATCLIVAQRIGTIKDADKIIVLDEGRVIGTGTHRELLGSCEIYREIACSQLSKEELNYA